MSSLRIEVTRGDLVESVHRVSAAVVNPEGQLLASTGDPELVTLWRSAAKPFQALPLIEDGGPDRFGLTDRELAITCASHSSEPAHLEVVDRLLAAIGVPERALACGPHPPLSPDVAARVVREGIELTPRWSNCSGKHAGLLALARLHGWPLEGYERAGHPVQERVLAVVTRFTGLTRDELALSIDGCATVCFGLPLRAMAWAYARFGAADEPACRRLWGAITAHPELVAGTGRFDTDLMRAWPGEVVAKVGAEGVYSAAIPSLRVGVAVKVEDGGWRAAPLAVLAVIRQVLEHGGNVEAGVRLGSLDEYVCPAIENTRGTRVGEMRVAGVLRFFDS